VQRELKLTQEQVAALEQIFQSNIAERTRMAKEEHELETRLEAVLRDGVEDDRVAYALVDTLTRVHARRNVNRTMMLVRMYRVLRVEQRHALRDCLATGERISPGLLPVPGPTNPIPPPPGASTASRP
jgi:Spy/CpxP family protein refolding chaperone